MISLTVDEISEVYVTERMGIKAPIKAETLAFITSIAVETASSDIKRNQ
jgi:hypothetical protein